MKPIYEELVMALKETHDILDKISDIIINGNADVPKAGAFYPPTKFQRYDLSIDCLADQAHLIQNIEEHGK